MAVTGVQTCALPILLRGVDDRSLPVAGGAGRLHLLNHVTATNHAHTHATTAAVGTRLLAALRTTPALTGRTDNLVCDAELRRLALVQILQLDGIVMDNVLCTTGSLRTTSEEGEPVAIIARQVLLDAFHSILVIHLALLRVRKNLISGRNFLELHDQHLQTLLLCLHHHHDPDGS